MKFPAWIFDKKKKKAFFIFALIFQEKLHALTEVRGLEYFVWKLKFLDLKKVTVVFLRHYNLDACWSYSARLRLPTTFHTVPWSFLFEGSAGSREYLKVICYWSCHLNGKSTW